MRKSLLLLILFSLYNSCEHSYHQEQEGVFDDYNKQEIQALNDIFLQLHYPDSIQGKVKNTLICFDSLICVPPNKVSLVNNRIENFEVYFSSLDSSYKPLLENLVKCSSPVFLDVKSLYVTGKYILASNVYYINKDSNDLIGRLIYSRIMFNNTFTKGVLYTSINCGEECGEEMILFIRKINNKWKPISKNTLTKS